MRNGHWPKAVITGLAVAVALPPYWLVRNPSEVVKTRQQAGMSGYGEEVNVLEAFRNVYQQQQEQQLHSKSALSTAIEAFYTGYGENIFYSLPADVIKFIVYDEYTSQLKQRRQLKNLPPLENAFAGAFATAVAQFVTTPLDVVRNRVMMDGVVTQSQEIQSSKSDFSEGIGKNKNKMNEKENDDMNNSYWNSLVTLAREEGLSGLFAGASPRVGKALLSGAIQFATYEETKQSVRNFFDKKQ